MDNKFKYLRSFLIFDQEDSRFKEGGDSSGYVKIEVRDGKGKLSCQVSNLKEDIKTNYKLYMIKADDSELTAVCAGLVPLAKGRGELNWRFNPFNVGSSGLTIEDFNIVAVLVESYDERFGNVMCPLASYRDGKIEWRQKMKRFLNNRRASKEESLRKFDSEKTANEEKNIAKENKVIADEEIISKYESVIESKYIETFSEDDQREESLDYSGNEGENENVGRISQDNEQSNVLKPEKENNGVKNKDDNTGEHSDKNKQEQSKEDRKIEGENRFINNTVQNEMKSETVGYKPGIKELAESFDRYFEKCNPFKGGRKEYRWWKVSSPVHLNNILYQKDIKVPILFNPMVLMAHFKHRHLIVGTYEDDVRDLSDIVCGVPGVYWVDEKPFGNICRWAQVEGSVPQYGAFGYWLVYINTKTGEVLNIS